MDRRLLACSAALASLPLLIWAWLRTQGPLPGERAIALRLFDRSFGTRIESTVLWVISFGAVPVVLATVLFGGVVVWRHFGPATAALVPLACVAPLLARLGKYVIDPTPLFVELRGQAAGPPWNFPSGHSAYVAALYGLFAWLALRRRRYAVAVPAALLIPAMGLSLVLHGGHLPSDVLAGWALGASWMTFLVAVSPRPVGT